MSVERIGFTAFLITVCYTVLGLPSQIYGNYVMQSTAGQSLLMNVLLLLTFVSWVVYGTKKRDWYIAGSNAPGAVCIAVVLLQFWIYRG